MTTTLPELNFVEPAPRRGTASSTPSPIRPIAGSAGPPRGMPMSITSTAPACALPGLDPQRRAWRRGTSPWRPRGPRRPRPRRCSRRRPRGRRRPRSAAAAAFIASITDPAGSRGAPVVPVPSSASTISGRAVEPRGVERHGRVAGEQPELLGRVALQVAGRPDGQDLDVAPGAAQQPRRDEPVAAVVALAADDRDPPGRARAGRSRARGPPPRAPSGPATGCPWSRSPSGRSRASRSADVERLHPARAGSFGHRHGRGHPVLWVSDTDDRRPELARPRPPRPRSA